MSSEERVLDMMAQLDEHSEKIPEGMYLQFCDHLKFFYQKDENKKRLELLELQRQLAVEVVGRLADETKRLRAQRANFEVALERQRGSRMRGSTRCGHCRQLGHNRRRCPQVVQ
jgi:hypothetical protein